MDLLVSQTGLAKTTLREHMLQLERDKYVRREYIRSGPGRPGLRYQLTASGHARFPSGERELLCDLLRYLKSEGKHHILNRFFESFWDKRLERTRLKMESAGENGDIPTNGQLDILCEILDEEGFMPEVESESEAGVTHIRECNCPFRSTIRETQLPCELEAGFYEKLFDRPVTRTTHIAEGDHSCTYRIDQR